MRLNFARTVYIIGVTILAVNFVLAYRQSDHIVWAGVCFGIAVLTFILSEWLQLRASSEIETIERAERDMMDELDVEHLKRGGGV